LAAFIPSSACRHDEKGIVQTTSLLAMGWQGGVNDPNLSLLRLLQESQMFSTGRCRPMVMQTIEATLSCTTAKLSKNVFPEPGGPSRTTSSHQV
jgi:hypothetical protein